MAYVLTDDGALAAYPFSADALRGLHPDTSFPRGLADEMLAEFGVFPVVATVPPQIAATQRLREGPPEKSEAGWQQTWLIEDLAPEAAAAKLATAKLALWTQSKAKRDALIDAGCEVPGIGRIDTDPASRANITGAALGAALMQMADQPFTIKWKLADNTIRELDRAAMLAVGLAVFAHVSGVHASAQVLGKVIERTSSFGDLDKIDIAAAWAEN